MADLNNSSISIFRSGKYTIIVIGSWLIWCLLMMAWPQAFAIPDLRAIVRVLIVFIPAIAFYSTGDQKQRFLYYFLLREHWLRGVLVGAGIALLYFGVDWGLNLEDRLGTFIFPAGFVIWFNFILGSPLAEELFFRGMFLHELKVHLNPIWATVISALAFAMLHVPQWLFLSDQTGIEILSSFVSIFIYGVLFAVLVIWTKSLWASIVPHWINNFMLLTVS
ncbi:MAG: lysostaphin resistance A-like protein [Anaerolineae bacterium]